MADVAVGRVMTDPGQRVVTAIYPGLLAEWFVIDDGRIAPGQRLARLQSVAGAR